MGDNSTFGTLSTINLTSFYYNESLHNFSYWTSNLNPSVTVAPRQVRPVVVVPHYVFILLSVINASFVLIGIAGNAFVCYVIGKGKRMYTVANLFLMNLAVADTCILTICYPLWIIRTFIGKWPLGSVMCKIVPSISDAFYGVSLGSITTISIYRYRMILFPLHTHMSFFQAKVIILMLWIISLLTISAPLYPVINFRPQHELCLSRWPSLVYLEVYQWMMLLMWYVIPLTVILYTYIRIRVYLRHEMQYKWLNGHSNGNAKDHHQQVSGHVMGIKRALRLLAPVVVVFTLFMLPWNIGRLLIVVRVTHLKLRIILEYLGATLLFANSAVNAFIYYFMSREFREEFRSRFRAVRRLFRPDRAGQFLVQRNYSMSFKTRIELLSVARSSTRKYKETVERLTVV